MNNLFASTLKPHLSTLITSLHQKISDKIFVYNNFLVLIAFGRTTCDERIKLIYMNILSPA